MNRKPATPASRSSSAAAGAHPGLGAQPPRSATHALVAFSGLFGLVVGVVLARLWHPSDRIYVLALLVMGCTALGVFIPDLCWQRVQRRELAQVRRAGSWARTATKYLGLIGCLAFVGLIYWLFPAYYRDDSFFHNYWSVLWILAPLILVPALPYLYWVDRRMPVAEDGLWQLGRALSGHAADAVPAEVGQLLLGWLVKAFFMALMFVFFCNDLVRLLDTRVAQLDNQDALFDFSVFALYFIDVALVSMTYLVSLRLTDTHLRSTEPTLLGWATALICYPPFNSLPYLDYQPPHEWGYWLGKYEIPSDLWGSAILALVVVYVWATVAFGGRFSNLTHRGIITNGPYRYTRHPAYLAKNLSWWLVSMPFMFAGNWPDTIRHCVLLGCLNFIYYLRAKTEERHLSQDPVYAEYAAWIEAHGLLRFVNRIPLLGALARWQPSKESPWTSRQR
ncbi:MAG TPA: isoprenylcysteine carboxylmethyltransferase family protein [Steroidobacteraceae bacterium]|nr:isoprenylcysteine carboxylmethyltransferase family protein [Steroidobacteraceae bacterium]